MRRRLHLRVVLALVSIPLVGLIALLLYGRFFERHFLRDRELQITVPDLAPDFDGYRIVQLSDFHVGGRDWAPRTMQRAVDLALAKHADLIVLTGDFVERTTAIAECGRLLAPLHARDGVLAVLGNHDYADHTIRLHAIIQMLEAHHVRVLRNASFRIRRGKDDLWIVGVDDGHSGHDFLPAALAGVPASARPVVLSHYPDLAWKLGPHRCALVLSGHAHGSQIRLPGLAWYARHVVARTRFSHGMYEVNRTPVHVSTGIGTSGGPYRVFARPEVVTIELRVDRVEREG